MLWNQQRVHRIRWVQSVSLQSPLLLGHGNQTTTLLSPVRMRYFHLNVILKIAHSCASVHCFQSNLCMSMLTGGEFPPTVLCQTRDSVPVPICLILKPLLKWTGITHSSFSQIKAYCRSCWWTLVVCYCDILGKRSVKVAVQIFLCLFDWPQQSSYLALTWQGLCWELLRSLLK